MGSQAEEILNSVFNAYNNGTEYTINTPPSGEIHSFNMALKEIEEYITFTRRDLLKISITLSDRGLEYFLENMD